VTTGHLLKDSEHVLSVCPKPIEIDATIEAVRKLCLRIRITIVYDHNLEMEACEFFYPFFRKLKILL